MKRVIAHEALFWPTGAPVQDSGEVRWPRLASELASTPYNDASRTPEKPLRPTALGVSYGRAQHALELSRAVEALAKLNPRQRRVIATHAWLADIRNAALSDESGSAARGRTRIGLRLMDIEALATVLADAMRWDAPGRRAMAPGAVVADALLRQLAALDTRDRRRLALHALFSELLPAGLGAAAADTVVRAARLDREVPETWVEMLRFVRRLAAATVSRDVLGERAEFPALDTRIVPMEPEVAARQWLERLRALGVDVETGGAGMPPGEKE